MQSSVQTSNFHAMAKPSGSDCNLNCSYCFYLEKEALYSPHRKHRMDGATLEAYVKNYISAVENGQEVAFAWQGGEPTLMGVDFYRRVVELQKQYGDGRYISNSFQTNGLLIDDEWCEFFVEHNFLVGLSLDGPADIHDEYRVTAGGKPSHTLVMRALHLFQQYGVQYNILACINRKSSCEPLRVYQFLRDAGVEFIQFIPVVERVLPEEEKLFQLTLRGPTSGNEKTNDLSVQTTQKLTEWSVLPKDYGCFLTTIFDEWVKHDVGKIYVMNFEWALANFMGAPGAACHHQPTCGRAVVVEHNGDVYACDHYVYPHYLLGNIIDDMFAAMLNSESQKKFGEDKFSRLSQQCQQCNVLQGCWGGCSKHRFALTDNGREELNYLCKGYNHFFNHLRPYLKILSDLINSGRSASDIMRINITFGRS